MDTQKIINIAIVGASGAVGREIIRSSQKINNINLRITILTRRILDEWKDFKNLNIIQLDDLNEMDKHELALENHQAFICVLGSRIKYPDFEKVDKEIPIQFAKLSKKLNAQYYGICSSIGSNRNSMFKYMRIKGECEDELLKIPGFIKNRENDFRIGELFGKLIFWSGIESKDLGQSMLLHAIQFAQENKAGNQIIENNEIIKYLKKNNHL